MDFKSLVSLVFFIATSSAFNLRCVFDEYNYGPPFGMIYDCFSTQTFSADDKVITSVTGTHLPGRTEDDVRGIWFWGNFTLRTIPRNATRFFPNIIVVSVDEAAIETLYGDELNEFVDLQLLSINNSNLTTISSRLFERTPHVRRITFWRNFIDRVGFDLFTPLDTAQLLRVDFSLNVCINQVGENLPAILSLISNLREQCPYYDELTPPPTVTTEAPQTTTGGGGGGVGCGNTEEIVCELKDNVSRIESEFAETRDFLIATDEKLIDGLGNANGEIESLKQNHAELNHLVTALYGFVIGLQETVNSLQQQVTQCGC